MSSFEHLLGKTILRIQRIDSEGDYDFYQPIGIVFSLSDILEKLVFSIDNYPNSVNISFSTETEIGATYGFEYSEHVLNNLKKEDELFLLTDSVIQDIRIFNDENRKVMGNQFIIKTGTFRKVELKTEAHKLTFNRGFRGWVELKDD